MPQTKVGITKILTVKLEYPIFFGREKIVFFNLHSTPHEVLLPLTQFELLVSAYLELSDVERINEIRERLINLNIDFFTINIKLLARTLKFGEFGGFFFRY